MARFKTYNASAGAGKTYNLVFQFLRFCLADDNALRFRSILAITFTNKAAKEMKSRIISKLEEFALFDENQDTPAMMADLADSLEVDKLLLRQRADKVLRSILHNYSALSVSTIDKFTNRLIRSFAQDLNLNSNYEVEMDSKAILSEAIDRFLFNVNEGQHSAEFLLRFIERQLEEGRSPRVENSLAEIGASLFEEKAYQAIKSIKGIDTQSFKNIRNELYKKKEAFSTQLKQRQEQILLLLDSQGVDPSLMNSTLRNYIYKNISDPSTAAPNATVNKVIRGEQSIYPQGKAKMAAPQFDPIVSELISLLSELIDFLNEGLPEYELLTLILKDIYGLAVLNEISRHLQELKEEQNRLPIGEFNQLISERLSNEPAEYLYEKLGERYSFFFIDEFQDTSFLQWRNILPLINNAMAAGGQSMIVGDGKQAIYRWRGGEVQQFVDLANNQDQSNRLLIDGQEQELYQREMVHLGSNYRSRKTIVDFNNRFFKLSGDFLKKNEYRELFTAGSHQEAQNSEEGFVDLRFFETEAGADDIYTNEQFQAIEEIIATRLANGFEYRDICILTRSNKRGSQISNHLVSKGIEVVSPDTLFVEQNLEVRVLLSAMRLLIRPDVAEYRIPLVKWMHDHESSQHDPHAYLDQQLKEQPDKLWKHLTTLFPDLDIKRVKESSLEALCQHLVRALAFEDQRNPYLHRFLDLVHKYQQDEGSDLGGFLRWWAQHGEKKTLSLPEAANAVKVMTIHKSKGLEFPITILAFADWRATFEKDATEWVQLDSHFELPAARIALKNSQLKDIETPYKQMKREHDEKVLLDNLNLLYVALTRAVDELHILTTKGIFQESTRICRYFQHFEKQPDSQLSYGQPVIKSDRPLKDSHDSLTSYSATDWRNKLKITVSAPLHWKEERENSSQSFGQLIHALLAEVREIQNAGLVIQKWLSAGALTEIEAEKAGYYLEQLLDDQSVKKYYQAGLEVVNEGAILMPGSKELRPDRVVIENDRAHIIDYKTGKQRNAHRQQVDNYRKVLRSMNYADGDNVLIYLGENFLVERWQPQNNPTLF